MGRLIDLNGRRFGRLLVVSRAGVNKHGVSTWHCRCECGANCIAAGSDLRSSHKRSCGCLVAEAASMVNQSHGHTRFGRRTATYRVWRSMIARCTSPSMGSWPDYGGKGIKVCERWASSYEAFLGDMGERPAGATIDRIDCTADYEPNNCRWATPEQQSANRRRPKNNSSGEKNVSWIKACKRWRVAFTVNGRKVYFGHYESFNEARAVAIKTRSQLFGDFANHA